MNGGHSVVGALLLSWLRPATAARRLNHVSLGAAWAIHLVSALLATALILVFLGWSQSIYRSRHGIWGETMRLIGDIAEDFVREPWILIAVTAAIVFGVEVAFAGLALLIAPWGARDETMGSSMANALRRTWLHTTHVLPAILLIGLSVIPINQARRAPGPPAYTPPRPPAGQLLNSQAQKDHQKAVEQYAAEYQAAWEQYTRQRPWILRHQEEVIGYLCFGALTWFLWTLFCNIGADRPTALQEHSPLCEFCGYNLTGASMDGRCPECGEPVAASLGPEVRPGTLWDRRREIGRWQAWWQCSLVMIFRPEAHRRRIQVFTGRLGYRSFLATHIPLVFLAAAAGVILCYVADKGRGPLRSDPEVVFWIAPLVGYFGVAGLGCLGLVAAWLAALHYRIAEGRNLLSGTVQVFAYTAGFLLLWTLCAAGLGIVLFLGKSPLRDLARALQMNYQTLSLLLWLVPNLACMSLYVRLVFRGTAGLRYANR